MSEIYTKDFIKSTLNNFIDTIDINTWLKNCNNNLVIKPYIPTQRPTFKTKSCSEEVNQLWSDSKNSTTWVIGIEPQPNQKQRQNQLISYISFRIFHDEVDGIRDNALYIVKTCTDKSSRKLGLSKILHWLVIQFALYLGDIDYIAAYVTDYIENQILLSFGSMSLVNIFNSLNINEQDGKDIKDEIFTRHNIVVNSIIVLGNDDSRLDQIKNEIITCLRPK